MSVMPNKPLTEMTRTELLDLLPTVASKYVGFSYNDILYELERRRMKADATRTFVLSIVAVVLSGMSLLASVLIALFK